MIDLTNQMKANLLAYLCDGDIIRNSVIEAGLNACTDEQLELATFAMNQGVSTTVVFMLLREALYE